MKKTQHVSGFVPVLKVSGLALSVLLAALILTSLAAGMYQTRKMERDPRHAIFRSGKLPSPPPDGFYKGTEFTGRGKSWQGKVFDRAASTGINQFTDGQRYRFKTYAAQGLRDKDKTVFRIDYNQPGNPWWLRFIVDEIVQIAPGQYQGKVHLQVIPGLPFTISYFELAS